MRIRLLLTVVWAACLFALALLFIKNNYRGFILPFAVMTMASVLLSATAVAVNLAWYLFVGNGCAVAAALAFVGSDIAAPVTCVQGGASTPRGRLAAWQVLVSICFFPLGLLSLFLGRKATTCRNCGYCWQT